MLADDLEAIEGDLTRIIELENSAFIDRYRNLGDVNLTFRGPGRFWILDCRLRLEFRVWSPAFGVPPSGGPARAIAQLAPTKLPRKKKFLTRESEEA